MNGAIAIDVFAASIEGLTQDQIEAVVEAHGAWPGRRGVRAMVDRTVAAAIARPADAQRAEAALHAAAGKAAEDAVRARMARFGYESDVDYNRDMGLRLRAACGSVVDALVWRALLSEREFRLWTSFWAEGTDETPPWAQNL